jgi:hypothetical protein
MGIPDQTQKGDSGLEALIMIAWKAYLKKVIPNSVFVLRLQYLQRRIRKEFQSYATAKDTFSRIYEGGYWGQSKTLGEKYYSGDGSHQDEIIVPYVSAVRRFLQSLGEKPDAVDLGCGDFAIGSQIRPYCGKYIAVDVVVRWSRSFGQFLLFP